jgi:hypothetical protein
MFKNTQNVIVCVMMIYPYLRTRSISVWKSMAGINILD